MRFAIVIEKAAGNYSAYVPDLPGCVATAGTVADVEREIRDAIEFCEKQKLKMILAGGAEAWKLKDLLRSRSVPVVLGPTLG